MAQTITVDATPNDKSMHRRPTLYFSQNDVGREFVIDLYSRDDVTIPSGATVKIQATKPSGFGFSVSGTVTNQSVAFTTTAVMTDESGRFPAELNITKSGSVIGTANFNIVVEKNPHPDGTTDGRSEEVIPELTVLVERIEAAADSIHELNVDAITQNYGTAATAVYDPELNKITFGIPRGNLLTYTDPNSDGNIVITKS